VLEELRPRSEPASIGYTIRGEDAAPARFHSSGCLGSRGSWKETSACV